MKTQHIYFLITFLGLAFSPASQATFKPNECQTVELKWGGWLPVATVSLYAPTCSGLADIKGDEPMALRFVFHRKISGSYFEKQANQSFINNLNGSPLEDAARLKSMAQNFNSHYVTMQPKDEYLIARTENNHLRLWKNKDLLVESTETDLSAHYFNIWLGEQPAIPKLKKLLQEALRVN